MKTGRSLQQIAAELDRQTKTRKDYLAPTDRLTMTPEPDGAPEGMRLAGLNGDSLGIRAFAHGQIAQDVGIPKPYYDRCLTQSRESRTLLAGQVNHWWRATPQRRLVRTLDGAARAVLSDRYRPLDNVDLAQTALPVLVEKGCSIVSAELTDTRLYIKAILTSMELEVHGSRQRGDVVQAGIVLSNSEVGSGAVWVEPLIYRLVCLNGMTAADSSLRKHHIGRGHDVDDIREMLADETRRVDDAAFWLKVRDVVRASFDEEGFRLIVERASRATDIRIESTRLDGVIELTTERLSLPKALNGSVLQHLIEGGDLSQWGLVNAVTRASQDVEDYDMATQMERAGGRILELAPTDWKRIAEAA